MVGPDQTCGVLGRFIGENVAPLRDLVHYCDTTNFSAAVLSLDQEKAFDRVDWAFFLERCHEWVSAGTIAPSFFFWRGKIDLVARTVVVRPRSCGGFGLVSARLKSQALLVQWVKRFWSSSYGWRLFFTYWTQAVFRVPPVEVLVSPFSFVID